MTPFTTGLGYTPIFRIDRNGDDITSNFEDRAVSVTIESIAGGGNGDSCDITLDDRGWEVASPTINSPGNTTLGIYLGYKETGLYYQGSFQIGKTTYLGMPKTMQIHGSSMDVLAKAKSPALVTFDGQTLGEIVDNIASLAGPKSSVAGDLASKKIPFLNQYSSAYHLLQELERRYNAIAKISNGVLSFTGRDNGLSASGTPLGKLTLQPGDLASWSIAENMRSAYSCVRASYFDKTNVVLKWITSATPAAVSDAPEYVIKRAFASADEAQSGAESMMAASNRSIRSGTISLSKGDPSIRGGQKFSVVGTRPGLDGDYVCEKASHYFTRESGLMTSLECYAADPTDSPPNDEIIEPGISTSA